MSVGESMSTFHSIITNLVLVRGVVDKQPDRASTLQLSPGTDVNAFVHLGLLLFHVYGMSVG